jgi:type II secretory pathway component PulF
MRTPEKILFFRRLALYLNSGVSIIQALSFIAADAKQIKIKQILLAIEHTVAAGLPLSAGLSKFPKQFDAFSVGFVYMGEISGNLSESLERLSIATHRRDSLRKKILGALAYPALILFGTVCITLFLICFIFPKIIPILKSFKTPLPITTQILISLTDFLKHAWPELFLALIAIISLGILSVRFVKIRRGIERVTFHIPIFADLFQYYALAVFLRTLSLQLRGGVRILPALELVRVTMPGVSYMEAIIVIENQITQGHRFSSALQHMPALFPSVIYQMIGAGETTGTLVENLETLANMYEENLDELSKALTVLIEPVLMIVMGLIVGFVALAIITPIYALTQNLSFK